MATLEDILTRFRNQERTRLLAFGSSNTEHFQVGMHWFDCLELAVNEKYGRVHTCINTGLAEIRLVKCWRVSTRTQPVTSHIWLS